MNYLSVGLQPKLQRIMSTEIIWQATLLEKRGLFIKYRKQSHHTSTHFSFTTHTLSNFIHSKRLLNLCFTQNVNTKYYVINSYRLTLKQIKQIKWLIILHQLFDVAHQNSTLPLWKGSHKLAQVISKRDVNVILITFPHPLICSSVNITYSGNNVQYLQYRPHRQRIVLHGSARRVSKIWRTRFATLRRLMAAEASRRVAFWTRKRSDASTM